MRKIKLAEKFSDIESSDVEHNSKNIRRIRAKKIFDSDEDDSDTENKLPPPPKKPIPTKNIKKKQMKDSSSLENITRKRDSDNVLQYVSNSSKKRTTEANVSNVFNSDEDNSDEENILLPPSKERKMVSITNVNNKKQMKNSSPLENTTRMRSNDNILQSVSDSSKKRTAETKVLKENNAVFLTDIEFKKELLRKCNKIDAKLDRVDDRLNRLEEKIENVIHNKNYEYFDITDIVFFPLQTKEALDNLEVELQDTNFFKNMLHFMKKLGGKTYHEMIVIILKQTFSNFLSLSTAGMEKRGKKQLLKTYYLLNA